MNIDASTLTLGAVILIQTATISFFLGSLSNRVRNNADRIVKIETGEGADGAQRSDLTTRLVALETRFDIELGHVTKSLDGMGREVRGMSRQVASLVSHQPFVAGGAALADTMSDG